VKVNATEMERTQFMTETWKHAAQDVINMLNVSRDPDKLRKGCLNRPSKLTFQSCPGYVRPACRLTYIHTTKFIERQNRKERIGGAGTE